MHTQNIENRCDVLIVGAGPSGLMMASQLSMQKINFRIIDKKEQLNSYSGALIIQAKSLEIFDQMGIANTAIEQGIKVENINFFVNGKKLLHFKLNNIGRDLTKYPFFLLLEQSKTELLLINFISTNGHFVERQTELISFVQTEENVTSILKLPNGNLKTVETKYLIGADGGHSTIRKQLNIPFEGTSYHAPIFVLDCSTEATLPENEISFALSKLSVAGFFPLIGKRWRIDGIIPGKINKKSTFVFNDVAKNFNHQICMNIKLQKPQWFSVFCLQERLASTFRVNRCFLIGDAAHVHSPIGAQGMNTGLQDAYNLSWKLSFVLKHRTKASLLNTYNPERKLIAKKIIRVTSWIFNLMTSQNLMLKMIRLYVLPFIIKLLSPFKDIKYIQRYFFKIVSEISIKYNVRSLSRKASSGFFLNAPEAGERFPYFVVVKKNERASLYERIRSDRFCLFIFAKHEIPEGILALAKKFNNILSPEIIPYNPETKLLYRRLNIKNLGCYLVRPDMYIAYRTNKPRVRHFEEYLNRIFI